MSFVIDETAIRKLMNEHRRPYTVTSSNLTVTAGSAYALPMAVGFSSTVSRPAARMSVDITARLFELRRQIVESGALLLTTEELDDAIDEGRRPQLFGY